MEFHIPYLKMLKEMGWETAVAARNDYENPEDCVIPFCDIYYDIQNGTVSDSPDKSYNAILPEGYTISSMGGAQTYQSRLKEWQSASLRQRDLSIVVTIAVYALSLIDAYVDAELSSFDISKDLSMSWGPTVIQQSPKGGLMQRQTAPGIQCNITF